MKVKIELLSNAVFGSGKSVPGGEDISILLDEAGFPYLKSTTFKGVLREEILNLSDWKYWEESEAPDVEKLFGKAGESVEDDRLMFTDFKVSDYVRNMVLSQKDITREEIINCFTDTYTFTSIENGVAKKGSLRSCRYINKGMIFYGEISCCKKYEEYVRAGLKAVKYIGSMKTRGFGRVKVSESGV